MNYRVIGVKADGQWRCIVSRLANEASAWDWCDEHAVEYSEELLHVESLPTLWDVAYGFDDVVSYAVNTQFG